MVIEQGKKQLTSLTDGWRKCVAESSRRPSIVPAISKPLSCLHRLVLGLSLLCVVPVATAHKFMTEILSEANLSADATFISVATFHLTQEDMMLAEMAFQPLDLYVEVDQEQSLKNRVRVNAVERSVDASCESSGSRTCGQFDHFTRGRSSALTTCNQLYQENPEAYPALLIPFFIAPSTFVDVDKASDNHHDAYHLSQGLTFDCGYIVWSAKELKDNRER